MLRLICGLISLLLTLTALAGPVNINSASAEELDRELSGVGSVLSRRIVDYRERHGPFQSPEDIQQVPYVGVRTFEKNRHNIRVDDGQGPAQK